MRHRPSATSLRLDRWTQPVSAADGGMSIAARRQADHAITTLRAMGIAVTLDVHGKVRFSSKAMPSRRAREIISIHGDVIEARLLELPPDVLRGLK